MYSSVEQSIRLPSRAAGDVVVAVVSESFVSDEMAQSIAEEMKLSSKEQYSSQPYLTYILYSHYSERGHKRVDIAFCE